MSNLFYRYDVAKDKNVFEEAADAYHGISFSAHVACYYQKSIVLFLRNVDKPYFIDPVTYRFAVDRSRLLRKEGDMKKSFEKLLYAYGNKIKNIIINEKRSLYPSDFSKDKVWQDDFINELCHHVLDFQQTFFGKALLDDSFKKLIKSVGGKIPKQKNPDFLIPPYFYAWDTNDPWYMISKHCAEVSPEIARSPVTPIICISKGVLLDATQLDKIVADYDSFRRIILWISDFNSTREGTPLLRGFLNLIRKFKDRDKEILSLYGSYFDLLLSKMGLSGFSTGLGYGESKDVVAPTGGPLLPRYYLNFLKYHVPRANAAGYLARHKERGLSCSCKICNRGVTIANMSENDIKKHFLCSRKKENVDVKSKELNEILAELVSSLNIPDEELVPFGLRKNHLFTWVDVVS